MYNLTSVKRVIAKVFADMNLQEETHRISDMIEYAGEAIEKIGAVSCLEKVIAGKDSEPLLKVENYQAAFPPNLHSILQVAYSKDGESTFRPMRVSTSNFDYTKRITKVGPDNEITLEDEDRRFDFNISTDLTYTIVPGYLRFNMKDGYVMLAYTRIPVDEEGYPMIPDHISFIEAVYWYIVTKLLYPKWVAGTVRDTVYADARSSWVYYCKQAYGTAMMPKGVDELETIKNVWLKIAPELSEHSTFFSTLGQEQEIRNAN